jgi:hypothetical protein
VRAPITLPSARPAYEIYIGIRALAIYAVRRKRFHFLAPNRTKLSTIGDPSKNRFSAPQSAVSGPISEFQVRRAALKVSSSAVVWALVV